MFESVLVLAVIFGAIVISARNNKKHSVPEEESHTVDPATQFQETPAETASVAATIAPTVQTAPAANDTVTPAIASSRIETKPEAAAPETLTVETSSATKAAKNKAAKRIKPKPIKGAKMVAAPQPEVVSPAAGSGERISLKNPKTGEIAAPFSNYRFTKRWIKEALVAEGLLNKIYRNNELTNALEDKIKNAIVQLEAMEKYRA